MKFRHQDADRDVLRSSDITMLYQSLDPDGSYREEDRSPRDVGQQDYIEDILVG